MDNQLIEQRTVHKRQALTIIAFLDATEDKYKIQQSKIKVIDFGSNRTSNEKEDDLKNIRKRKDGRWEFRKMVNGQSFHCISKKRDTVMEYAANLKRQFKGITSKPNTSIKFWEYAEEFYELFKKQKVKDKSREEWENAIKVFKSNFDKPFRSYSPNDFQRFINEVAEQTPTTAKKLYDKICAICRKAYWSGIIKVNIPEVIEKPEVVEKPRRALSVLEQVKFLNLLKKEDKDFQCFCLFCLITSARREEAYRYKPQDFNRRNMTLFVNGTKTLNAPRTIKITPEFANILEQIGKGFKHTADYYSRKAKELFEKMGSPDLVFYSLRHTCATNMVYLGIPSDYRKHIMGHGTVLVTDRVYTHIEMGITKTRMHLIYKNLYFTDF